MTHLFSIRAKFLSVLSVLLMGSVLIYLLIAVHVFKTDKTELVFDLNRSQVSNLAAELETQFVGISDQFRIFAMLSVNGTTHNLTSTLFGQDSEVVFASLFKQDNPIALQKIQNNKYLETYGLKSDFFEAAVATQRPTPFEQILREGEAVWNATVEGGTPLIGYGRSVVIEDARGLPLSHLAVIGYIQPDKILKSLQLVSLSEISIVDAHGKILIHQNLKNMLSQANTEKTPLFEAARDSKIGLSVVNLKDEDGDFLGAFAKSYHDKIYVLAKASQDKAFVAVRELVSRSLLFALIIVTVSLLFALLLSKSLTEPLSILVEGMEKVSSGDLNTQIHLSTRDETQVLATSFNHMIRDLKSSRDELQVINQELDQKVKDRTHELQIQNQAVKEAQEALLRTTRLASAGEIAGRAAHEVLNPLTGIMTRVSGIEKRLLKDIQPQIDMMKDIFESWRKDQSQGGFENLLKNWQSPSGLDPRQSLWDEDFSNLDSIHKSFGTLLLHLEKDTQFLLQEGHRINKIINGMRQLSRLNSDVKTYSLKKLMVDCRNIMADLFSQAEIQIHEDYFIGEDNVEIDRDEFIQAVTNLMRNALQSMQSSGVRDNYRLKLSTLSKNDQLLIEISDNGSGVDEKHQALLFEIQFTTKGPEEGTGLGLGISRRFIRAHGGDIEFVASLPFQETKFRICLPKKSAKSQPMKEGAA